MRSPRTAYILLWFPKPSETFIFGEVTSLLEMGLPLQVYTLYGRWHRWLSPEMKSLPVKVERLGIPLVGRLHREAFRWFVRDPAGMARLLREFLVRPWRGAEKTGESLWAFPCAFYLARRFQEEGIEHIHAPWACGPATAAWLASRLTGIPFTFTARSWDIHPPDSLILEKIRDAALVRGETRSAIEHLARLPGVDPGKFRLTYNGVPLRASLSAPVSMRPPYGLLALGRFVEKKGFEYLIRACGALKSSGLDFRLTLAGDGPLRANLKRMVRGLGLSGRVDFPGFVPYHGVSELFLRADLFIAPSVIEESGDVDGIPTVLMESLTHGVPVIATSVGGIPELVEDGVTGLLIPQRDPQAVERAILWSLSNRERSVEMAERGRARVLDQFDPRRNHALVLRLYEELERFSRASG